MNDKSFSKFYKFSSAPLSNDECDLGYLIWREKYFFKDFDERALEVLEVQCQKNGASLLKESRQALLYSQRFASRKLGTDFNVAEANEIKGAITLNSLRRAAEAIDCELVYRIRPKEKKLFSRIVWEQVLPHVRSHGYFKKCLANKRPYALAKFVEWQFGSLETRKELNWTEKLPWLVDYHY